MFNYLRFRWKLRNMERWQRKTSASYSKDMAAARKRGATRDELQEIMGLAHDEDRTYDTDIYGLHTRYLLAEAHRLIVPVPSWEDGESWDEGFSNNLTKKGINDLRAAIRAEKKVRREQVLMWVPAATALTGLAGAAIGVIAAWFGFGTAK